MQILDMSSFIKIMQTGLMTYDRQESAAIFLLNAINEQQYVISNGYRTDNLSSKKISRIVSRQDPVPDGIKQASYKEEVIGEVINYFRKKVMKELNPHLIDDTIDKFIKLISEDTTIPKRKKESLLSFYNAEDIARFLAEVFLYAANRPNKKIDEVVKYEDIPLLAEANFECPLCHKKLVDTYKGQPIKRYKITQIFPENLDMAIKKEFDVVYDSPKSFDHFDNLIALDKECSKKYLFRPTVEEYKKLCSIKKEMVRNYEAKRTVNSIELDDDIRTVIDALIKINDVTEVTQLEYDVLRIDEKIESENFILKNEIQQQVLMYYRYIENVFSESGVDFDMIATEVKVSYMKLEKAGLSQPDVVAYLSEWMRNKAGLSSDRRLACNIVVSFFVQNCEAFHK